MSDSENDPLSSLLSSFALGPSWARAAGGAQQDRPSKPGSTADERPPRRDERGDDDRRGGTRDRDGQRRPFQGRGGKFDDRRAGPPRNEEAPPAEGIRVTLTPDAQAVHLIGKEVHQVARVYPLFDVAKILLAERARCRAVFEAPEPQAPLFRGILDESVFLTREEAARHLWASELRDQLIEEETVEVDPPAGSFQLVARCGMSGEWLGPPNFHAYQTNLRRIHRERFANVPFASYTARVRTERGEEVVNAWLETMKKKTRWRIKGDADDAWIGERVDAERALATKSFDKAFKQVRYTEVLASIPPKNLSPSLMTSLKIAGNHARNHPAILIPAVCKAVEAEHLPVFKRQGKLFTGPARPHPLPVNAVLAERPGIMVDWIRNHKPAKLEGLWQAVLPEGSTAPPADFASDLFWLLHQGHILLFTDDTLVVQEVREAQESDSTAEPKSGKKNKKKSKKATDGNVSTADPETTATAATDQPADDEPALVDADESVGITETPTPEIESVAATTETESRIIEESPPAPDSIASESPEPEGAVLPESTVEPTMDSELPKNPPPGVDGASEL